MVNQTYLWMLDMWENCDYLTVILYCYFPCLSAWQGGTAFRVDQHSFYCGYCDYGCVSRIWNQWIYLVKIEDLMDFNISFELLEIQESWKYQGWCENPLKKNFTHKNINLLSSSLLMLASFLGCLNFKVHLPFKGHLPFWGCLHFEVTFIFWVILNFGLSSFLGSFFRLPSKKGVEFCQGSIGTIRRSIATKIWSDNKHTDTQRSWHYVYSSEISERFDGFLVSTSFALSRLVSVLTSIKFPIFNEFRPWHHRYFSVSTSKKFSSLNESWSQHPLNLAVSVSTSKKYQSLLDLLGKEKQKKGI